MQNGSTEIIERDLVKKYNTQGPRYTSYPTVPYWEDTPSIKEWTKLVKSTFAKTNRKEGISLYIHFAIL